MTKQAHHLLCIFIVVLLPDWLSSAELRPPHANHDTLNDAASFTDSEEYQNPAFSHNSGLRKRSAPLLGRQKRLMGIFRCNGWGPGCTQFDGDNAGGYGGGGRGRGGARLYHGGERGSSGSPIGKFQPFFTLTSGGSWGPTGKKRASTAKKTHMDLESDVDTVRLSKQSTPTDRKFAAAPNDSRKSLLKDVLSSLIEDIDFRENR